MRYETLAQGKHLTFLKHERWEFVRRNRARDVAILVAITPSNSILFVEQHRIPVNKRVIELPAGLVGDEDANMKEGLFAAAQRELLEETGYMANHLQFLFRGPSSVGLTDEVVSFLLATKLEKISNGGGVDGEAIELHEIPLDECLSWLETQQSLQHKMVDPKIFSGLFFLFHPFLKRTERGVDDAPQ